jgi:hypothetical protein
MTRPRKLEKDRKKVTGFSLTPSQIKKIAVIAKAGQKSRSELVGSWADLLWEKSRAKVGEKKKVEEKKTGKKKLGKRLKRQP